MKSRTSLLLLSTLGTALAGDDAKSGLLDSESVSTGWKLQSVSAGAAWRSLGKLDYKSRSSSNNYLIPSVVGGSSISLPPIGDVDIPGNRNYNDGFVNLDGTNSADNETWFWGYENSDQVRGNNLDFLANGSRSDYSDSSSFAGENSSSDTLDAFTPQIDLVLAPPSCLNLPFDGVLVSFWAFSEDSNNRFSNFTAGQQREDYRIDYRDTFNIANIQPLIGAPYTGTSGGPGPILPNLPSNRSENEILIGGDSAVFTNSISTSLDLEGYSFAVGPTWQGNFGSNWGWQASAGMTFNLFNWDAKESESLQYSLNGAASTEMREWKNSDSGTDFRLGVYAKGEVIRRLNEDWFAKGSFQFEMADSVEIEVGGSEYKFKPRGYALGLSLGYQF